MTTYFGTLIKQWESGQLTADDVAREVRRVVEEEKATAAKEKDEASRCHICGGPNH